MAYHVEFTYRANRDLREIYRFVQARDSLQAQAWFNGLSEAILSLHQNPGRSARTPEDSRFRHLLYGKAPHIYRVIYAIDRDRKAVTVLHVRHGARTAFSAHDTNQ